MDTSIPQQPLKQRALPWLLWLSVCVLLFWAYEGAEINFAALFQYGGNIGQLLSEFFPPDFSDTWYYLQEMVITIQIAIWGTVIAVFLSIPFGLLSAKNLVGWWVLQPIRRLMDSFRAINEMVFAILFVVAVGLGPFAGVLALIIHTTGVLSKLFSEAVEAIDEGPVEGIRATGASWLSIIRYGVIPQVLPLWSSYTLYRFESNVRAATVLGIVGAGGIGQILYESIRGFNYPEACAILIVIIVSVSLIDSFSGFLRKLTI